MYKSEEFLRRFLVEEKVENKPRAGEFPFLALKNAIEIFEAVNFGNTIKRSPGICVC